MYLIINYEHCNTRGEYKGRETASSKDRLHTFGYLQVYYTIIIIILEIPVEEVHHTLITVDFPNFGLYTVIGNGEKPCPPPPVMDK